MKTANLTTLMILLLATVTISASARADENTLAHLRLEVERLSGEVARLAAEVETLNAMRPTVTMLMPSIAERFHVMHYAGESQDWALAAHELLGIRHLFGLVALIDPQKGILADGIMQPHFDRLDAAIEHASRDAFDTALRAGVEACNACHAAVGSPSMRVSLDAADNLSLRHSHLLTRTRKPGEHTHKH